MKRSAISPPIETTGENNGKSPELIRTDRDNIRRTRREFGAFEHVDDDLDR
jgi:hypothetical protein